ncbi:MAG: terminase large subunit [Pisciglobus halotolerans]|nr:terminase large subunit [Pisciglobus halotolerans]
MISNKHVDEYINLWKKGKVIFNKERELLVQYLRDKVLSRNDIYFDDEQIENYIAFSNKNFFELDTWEKFIAPFVFLYFKEDNEVFFDRFFITLGRGGGKNGFITTLCAYFISPLHNIRNYDTVVVANSEDQAKVSFNELYDIVDTKEALKNHFINGKAQIVGKLTNSVFKYATSNARTKDGGRQGCVIYDEIHEMENDAIVNVFSGGLGKAENSREFFISTNGYVRDGYYDKMFKLATAVLEGNSEERIFPFICKLDSHDEVDNSHMWEKANPALSKPLTKRSKRLKRKMTSQYLSLAENPSGRQDFMTKRMNVPEEDLEKSVATYEEIKATNRPFPVLEGKQCIGGLDYASIRDFAAVGILFKDGEEYIWKTHSFARKQYLDRAKLKPPIYEWEEKGLLTIVDEPSIDPRHIVDWFVEMKETYDLKKVVADNFRMDLLRPLFAEAGIEIEIVRNPRSAHALLAPRIEDGFANRKFIFGDNPLMNWYTNNVLVNVKKDGNKEFLKKDEHRRKTDGFQAFIHALWRADDIQETDIGGFLDMMDMINF